MYVFSLQKTNLSPRWVNCRIYIWNLHLSFTVSVTWATALNYSFCKSFLRVPRFGSWPLVSLCWFYIQSPACVETLFISSPAHLPLFFQAPPQETWQRTQEVMSATPQSQWLRRFRYQRPSIFLIILIIKMSFFVWPTVKTSENQFSFMCDKQKASCLSTNW